MFAFFIFYFKSGFGLCSYGSYSKRVFSFFAKYNLLVAHHTPVWHQLTTEQNIRPMTVTQNSPTVKSPSLSPSPGTIFLPLPPPTRGRHHPELKHSLMCLFPCRHHASVWSNDVAPSSPILPALRGQWLLPSQFRVVSTCHTCRPCLREHGSLQYIVSKGMHVWIKEQLIGESKSFPTPEVVN